MSIETSSPSNTAGDSIPPLLEAARRQKSVALGELLQLYRNYLTVLAATHLDNRLRRRMNPSDLVQEAMLAAHQQFQGFRGGTERELLAWLRQILINCLRDGVDNHLRAKKRDLRREVPMEPLSRNSDQSGVFLDRGLADTGPSPSEPSHQRERAVELANQLARLRPEHREVIVLRNLQGLSFNDIAQRMERKPGSVRMLWLRAMDQFRKMHSPSDSDER